jgi:putative membrane protein
MSELFGKLPANFLGFTIAGALIALGVLVPGLSPSNLLLILGIYSPMLIGFKNFDIVGVFLPIAVGGILAMLLFSKGMEYLLEHHYSKVYHLIIGLVIASTINIVLPNPHMEESITYSLITYTGIIMSVVCFVLGVILGLWMSKLEEKYK